MTDAFNAWLQGDGPRLRELASDAVADFLLAHAPDDTGEWSGPACDGAMGHTYCSWTQPGVELVLGIANEPASLGQEHAVDQVWFTVPAGGVAVWPFTTADQGAATQTSVDGGHQPWLLDPATTATSYAEAELGWHQPGVTEVDPGTYRVTDPASGAQASLRLTQPVRQGQGGIWAVVRAG